MTRDTTEPREYTDSEMLGWLLHSRFVVLPAEIAPRPTEDDWRAWITARLREEEPRQ